MKKLIFLTVLSLLLGVSTFSTAHDTIGIISPKKATQVITFNVTYFWNGQFVPYSNLYINGQFVATIIYGPWFVQANIGDSYYIQDLNSTAAAFGTITSTVMNVQLGN
ncbi:hypothetical protein HHL17_31765 [Chitinophaga sp. G-6-1-13]|uniref:Uncharacterized protein n=1 Tax=Chitinophaga fulva TaxID=2728842 RepID=A0A848GUM6_9BACT|nr:hypothetical protein [Chitinophaga fulva]NML41807.1 hypothetical protein [Chitinophaga fulva]